MTKTDFEKLLQDSSFATVKAQATQAQQASQANKDSIASLDVTPAGIATLVNSAIQSGSVKETITRTAQGAISNNYVTDAKLNALIQADSNGNIVIGSPESKGVILGSVSTPLPITAGNVTVTGDVTTGTFTAKGYSSLQATDINGNLNSRGNQTNVTNLVMSGYINQTYKGPTANTLWKTTTNALTASSLSTGGTLNVSGAATTGALKASSLNVSGATTTGAVTSSKITANYLTVDQLATIGCLEDSNNHTCCGCK